MTVPLVDRLRRVGPLPTVTEAHLSPDPEEGPAPAGRGKPPKRFPRYPSTCTACFKLSTSTSSCLTVGVGVRPSSSKFRPDAFPSSGPARMPGTDDLTRTARGRRRRRAAALAVAVNLAALRGADSSGCTLLKCLVSPDGLLYAALHGTRSPLAVKMVYGHLCGVSWVLGRRHDC